MKYARFQVAAVLAGIFLAGACGGSSGQANGSGGSGGGAPDGGGSGGASGDGGGVTDAPVSEPYTGPVVMPAGLFPAPGAQDVCPDPALRLTMTAAPTLGTAGRIQVWDDAAPATPVATIDMAVPMGSETIGGSPIVVPRPVYLDGNDVIVHVRSGALTYGKTYHVTVEGGGILSGGGSVVITDPTAWRFATAAAAPADLSALTVSPDGVSPGGTAGTARFCSVQGAIDAVPAGNTTPVTITINNGTYREIIYFTTKSFVTLHGQDRKLTIIAATNNNGFNNSSRARSLVGIDNSGDVTIENLTIRNLTPQGGTQAEALRLQNCERCVVRDADLLSYQDTVQWSGRVYARNLYIEGNVDFVWGNGTVYFDRCEIKTVVRTGYGVQARNASNIYGYVFVDSKLTADPGIVGHYLARIDVAMFPASHVAYIDCELGPHINAGGWLITGAATAPMLRFWEYGSKTPAGTPVDVGLRAAASAQLTPDMAAMMRDPTVVLRGWQPPTQ